MSSRATRTRAGRRTTLAALAAALSLAAVAGAELLLRTLWPAAPATLVFQQFHPGEERRGLLVDDARTAYALAPHYRDSPAHAGAYATGAWPYRNAPPRLDAPAPPRVAVLGDSCVYGVGVLPCETLPARLADALAQHGLGPERVQVENRGVPGYSTAQSAAQLEELLERAPPRLALLYLAAWNDQSPALVAPDAALLAARKGWRARLRTTALYRLLAAGEAGRPLDQERLDAIRAAWERGAPLHGTRVAPEELTANVEAILAACRAAGVEAWCVLPAHPAATLASHPRLAQDRERVRRAAERAGVPTLDARALLDASGLDDAAAFVDFVHPSPRAHALLAQALAERIAPGLRSTAGGGPGAAPPASGPPRITDVAPERLPCFGDVTLRVTLAGVEADGALPTLALGHAPLLELRALEGGVFEGLVTANGPGPRELVVRTAHGCARRAAAVTLVEPTPFVGHDGGGPFLGLRSRPGDRALVLAAEALAATPALDARGTGRLDPGRVVASFPDLVAGADGVARLPVSLAGLDASGGLWLQALVTPAGSSGAPAARYSSVLDLRQALADEAAGHEAR